jgi:xanthine dehydrogenase accessory factor
VATLTERVSARRPHLWVFGAGHVGQALVRMLAELALFDLTWIDSRAHLLPPGLPECVHPRAAAAPVDLIGSARAATRYVVMTHDHGLDYELCRAVLRRGDAAWLGLIGSASKAARFRARLLRDGLGQDQIAGLTCPIGVRGIASKLPAAIAISIAAELLQQHAAGPADAPWPAATAVPPAQAARAAAFAAPAWAANAAPPSPAAASAAHDLALAAPRETRGCGGACEACGTDRGEAP